MEKLARLVANQPIVEPRSHRSDICCSSIVDDKKDALLCEGTCKKWFHRYCAGVSLTCFRSLSNSSTPFVCWLCSQELHCTIVSQLQATLREGVVELRSDIRKTDHPQWSKVVAQSAGPTRARKMATQQLDPANAAQTLSPCETRKLWTPTEEHETTRKQRESQARGEEKDMGHAAFYISGCSN